MEVIHKISKKGRKKGCPWGKNCNDCNVYRPTYVTKIDGSKTEEWDCQANNLVMFLGEFKDKALVLQQVMESARNEAVKRQDKLLGIAIAKDNTCLPGKNQPL